MKGVVFYRISAGLLLLFAALHTYGFLSFKPASLDALMVRDAMTNVHFQVRGASLSYGGFYRGFGLFVTAYLLFSVFLALHLARHPNRSIGWGLCSVQIASTALACIYFAAPQIVFSAVVAICIGCATYFSQAETRS